MTLERYTTSTWAPSWVVREHAARYRFAQAHTTGVVVDCACGAGEGTAMFAAHANRVLAFDVSDDAIAEAQLRHSLPNIVYRRGDATSLPVPDGSVDAYISLETIEHLGEVQGYLAEARRILKPSGQFVCSTPNRSVTNPGKKLHDKPANPFHVREYDIAEFRALLAAFFQDVSMYGMNPVPRWLPAVLGKLNRHGQSHLPTRVHQAVKLCSSVFRSRRYHDVVDMCPRFQYEYLIAVARTETPG